MSESATDEYQQLSDAYVRLLAYDPNTCVELGLDDKLDQLPDPSLQAQARHREQAEALQARAERFAATAEDFHQRLDARLIALSAGRLALQYGLAFNGALQIQQLPDAGEQISSGIFYLVTNDPRPAERRLADICARLEQVPEFLTALLARLDTPLARWVAIDLETVAELPEFFASLVAWAEEESYAGLERLQTAVSSANDALEAYSRQLADLSTTTQLHIGVDKARALVKANGIELSLEEIHKVARDFVTGTRAHIEALRVRLVEKYALDSATTAAELQKFLARRYAVKVPDNDFAQVIQRYKDTSTEILSFVAERDLFPVPGGQDMNIMQTPSFMAPMIPAGAMMPPAALREGTRTSQVYLTLSEELLDEHTELGIPLMMVHEGIPGHHLQLATAAMHDSPVRRTFSANEHAEGWTTMLEDYMLDQGLMAGLTDEARFVTKLDLSRIGARVGIDLYFMTGEVKFLDIGYDLAFEGDDPFVNAAALLIAATGFTPGRAQAELNWYSQERGYPLSYLVGNHLVWQLKRDYQQAVGDSLSPEEVDRQFHRIYLESGNMPVAMLREVYAFELGGELATAAV